MAVITGSFPPGPYQGTFAVAGLNGGAATSIGLMEGPIRHQESLTALPIRCSLYGQNIIDYIVQGGGVFFVIVLKEWSAGSKALMHSWNSVQGTFPLTGTLLNTFFGQLVLTALAGTPAATVGPVTRTYAICGLLPGHVLDESLGPVERNIPFIGCVLPQKYSTNDGQPVYFVDT